MQGVNLKLLQTFVLVADHASFRRAAEVANRAPSAISMQVRDLEAQVGMRLFVRTAQRISLTPEGQALYDRTHGAMADIDAGLEYLSQVAAQRRGQVTIACAPTLASFHMGNILAGFARRHPESIVSVREVAPKDGIRLIQEQKVEFYIGPEIMDLQENNFEPLMDDQLLACAPPDFDPGGETISLADLQATPVILLDAKTALHQLVGRITHNLGVTLNVRYELQNASTALALVEAGLGIAILPTTALHLGDPAKFRAIPLNDPLSVRRIGIVTAKGFVTHGYSEQLLRFIRENFVENA
ncbi:MAG: LysR family transcriptional regulator [Pseudomonadota bacterium]